MELETSGKKCKSIVVISITYASIQFMRPTLVTTNRIELETNRKNAKTFAPSPSRFGGGMPDAVWRRAHLQYSKNLCKWVAFIVGLKLRRMGRTFQRWVYWVGHRQAAVLAARQVRGAARTRCLHAHISAWRSLRRAVRTDTLCRPVEYR